MSHHAVEIRSKIYFSFCKNLCAFVCGAISALNCLAQTPATEYPFERLFTTADERRQLDQARQQGKVSNEFSPGVDAPILLKAARREVRLSGFVRRADGKNMVWIDGKSELSAGKDDTTAAHGRVISKSLQVPLQFERRSATLKPGQVWILNETKNGSPTIKEVYQVHPSGHSSDKQLPEPISKEAEPQKDEEGQQSEPE